MEISTSTNICAFQRGRDRLPPEFSIRACAEAGYRVLDINFCMAMNPESPMRGKDWEAYVRSLGTLAGELGIRFNQSHLPYYDVGADRGTPKAALMEELIQRSVIGTAMLGARWAVTHPFTVGDAGEDFTVSRQANLDYYASHVETAQRYGIGIALENDFEYLGGPRRRVYCAAIPELIDLCDAFHDPEHMGVCYDFGHANLTGGFHRQNLNQIGSRLKAIHVQDNHGQADEHLLPFFGSIDWREAMTGLAESGYAGDLTFEIQEFGRYLPKDLKYLAVRDSLLVGERLIRYYQEAVDSLPTASV
ncbi:MAG: sugar phosphate isomerase/epimerase [Clostridia bacterium]|nr:sugar phosphate isomerase/epimerase [Clostridia bacterium]